MKKKPEAKELEYGYVIVRNPVSNAYETIYVSKDEYGDLRPSKTSYYLGNFNDHQIFENRVKAFATCLALNKRR